MYNKKDPQKKHRLGTFSKKKYWMAINMFQGINQADSDPPSKGAKSKLRNP